MMSTSQTWLRALIVVSSVVLALTTALATPRGTLVGATLIILLTPFVALDPASRLTALLLALHGVNWLSSAPTPTTTRHWGLTLVAALCLLMIHLAAALAAALPASAPLPRATLRRWGWRALAVLGLSLPVWALLVTQSASPPAGVPFLTYAAVASVAILALALWLSQARAPTPEHPRG